jgi:hypothetical protein
MIVIIILGFMFATANKRRDRKLAEGHLEYNPALATGLEDVSDWKNKAFRYVGKHPCPSINLLRLLTLVSDLVLSLSQGEMAMALTMFSE